MQHAWRTEGEDLEVVELLRSISQSQKVPPEACFRESPTPISGQMRLVRRGKATIFSLHRSALLVMIGINIRSQNHPMVA